MVVFWQKLLYSGKSGCVRENSGCIWDKCLYSGKMVVFRQGGCIWLKMVVFRQNWLYSGKSGCIGENGCIRAKVVDFGKKWL